MSATMHSWALQQSIQRATSAPLANCTVTHLNVPQK
jgi:hypothetical protein